MPGEGQPWIGRTVPQSVYKVELGGAHATCLKHALGAFGTRCGCARAATYCVGALRNCNRETPWAARLLPGCASHAVRFPNTADRAGPPIGNCMVTLLGAWVTIVGDDPGMVCWTSAISTGALSVPLAAMKSAWWSFATVPPDDDPVDDDDDDDDTIGFTANTTPRTTRTTAIRISRLRRRRSDTDLGFFVLSRAGDGTPSTTTDSGAEMNRSGDGGGTIFRSGILRCPSSIASPIDSFSALILHYTIRSGVARASFVRDTPLLLR